MAGIETAEVELPPELDAEVAALAEALDRSWAWVIEQAVSEFVAAQRRALDELSAAREAPPAPDPDGVIAWVRARCAAAERRTGWGS